MPATTTILAAAPNLVALAQLVGCPICRAPSGTRCASSRRAAHGDRTAIALAQLRARVEASRVARLPVARRAVVLSEAA